MPGYAFSIAAGLRLAAIEKAPGEVWQCLGQASENQHSKKCVEKVNALKHKQEQKVQKRGLVHDS